MKRRAKAKRKKLIIKLSGIKAKYDQLGIIFSYAEEMPFHFISKIGDLAREIAEIEAEIKLLEDDL